MKLLKLLVFSTNFSARFSRFYWIEFGKTQLVVIFLWTNLKYISSSLFQVSAGCVARPCTGAEEEALGPGECPSNCCVASLCNFGSCQSGWVLDYYRATRECREGEMWWRIEWWKKEGDGKGVGTGYGHDSVWMVPVSEGPSSWDTGWIQMKVLPILCYPKYV